MYLKLNDECEAKQVRVRLTNVTFNDIKRQTCAKSDLLLSESNIHTTSSESSKLNLFTFTNNIDNQSTVQLENNNRLEMTSGPILLSYSYSDGISSQMREDHEKIQDKAAIKLYRCVTFVVGILFVVFSV